MTKKSKGDIASAALLLAIIGMALGVMGLGSPIYKQPSCFKFSPTQCFSAYQSDSFTVLIPPGANAGTATITMNPNFTPPFTRIHWLFGAAHLGATSIYDPVIFPNTQSITWINMPSAVTEFNGGTSNRFHFDEGSQIDITFEVNVLVAGSANAVLWVQYSTDLTTWKNYTNSGATPATSQVSISTIGFKNSTLTNIPTDAINGNFVYIRVMGGGGNGIADPQFGYASIIFRHVILPMPAWSGICITNAQGQFLCFIAFSYSAGITQSPDCGAGQGFTYVGCSVSGNYLAYTID